MKQLCLLLALFVPVACFAQTVKSPTRPKPVTLKSLRLIVEAQNQKIAELEARAAQTEADNAKLKEANTKLEDDTTKLRDGFRDLLADTDHLAQAGKGLMEEHQKLSDRYNQLIRDYNSLMMQANTFAEQVRSNNAMARAQRDAAFYNYLSAEQNRIRQTFQPYTPPPPVQYQVNKPVNCTSQTYYGTSTVYTNCY